MSVSGKRNQLIPGSGIAVAWKTARDGEGRWGRAARAAGRPMVRALRMDPPTPGKCSREHPQTRHREGVSEWVLPNVGVTFRDDLAVLPSPFFPER